MRLLTTTPHLLDRFLDRLELTVVLAALAALVASLVGWVVLKGLATHTTAELWGGLVLRAFLGAVVLGGAAWRFTKSVKRTSVVIAVVALSAWLWRDVGVTWAGNVLGWLQDGSLLTWWGGLRGVATRLTLVVALGGAAMATASGRHVAIDLLSRVLSDRVRRWTGFLGTLVAAVVCASASWGFFDFVAVDVFHQPPTLEPLAKIRSVGSACLEHTRLAGRQAGLDLRVSWRVLTGTPWDRALSADEWNEWLGDDAALVGLRELDPTAARPPFFTPPGLNARGLLGRDFALLIPLGLVWLAFRSARWLWRGGPSSGAHGGGAAASGGRRTALAGSVGVVGGLAAFAGWPAALVGALALLGAPLFAVMAGGAELAWLLSGEPLNRLAPRVMDEQFAGSPVLVTIPLFTLLGYVLAESKAPQRIVEASRALFGWLPGGMALVCLAASAFFTSLTGGSGVTIVAIGGLLYPTLRAQGHSERFSLGLVTTGGSLGLLLPPSLPILVYALVAGLELTTTFKAGLLPAVLVLVVLAVWSAFVATRERVPRERLQPRAAAQALFRVKWELGVPLIILGGLATSLTSLDESAAVALFGALAAALFIHRDLKLADVPRIAREALALSGAVILILMMANALMNYVIDRQLPAHVLEGLLALGLDSKWQFLVVLNVFLLVVGMVMDGFSALLVAVPLVLPFAARFGLHPFHLAMMVLLNLELAFCMPPLGLNLFISSFRFERPVASLYRAVLPFVGLLTVCLVAVMGVPWLSTALVQSDVDAARAKALALGVPPREAWILECVQADTLNPQPCSEADRVQFAAPDAGTSEDEDELLRQMLEP